MKARIATLNALLVVLTLGAVSLAVQMAGAFQGSRPGRAYEVWVIDQSDTTNDGGGTLYIYSGDALSGPDAAKASPERIDLGGAARILCAQQTGTAPQRPHMIFFNAANTHALLSFVASGHVLVLNAATRAPIACLDAGAQAHSAYPSPDQKYAIVANQNGKLLQRIGTDYAANKFMLEDAATLNLAACTTPSGAACEGPDTRPDNAPICPVIDNSSRFAFVTLRGGGLLVVEAAANPMRIVAEYDKDTVHPNGCGGVFTNGKVYINAGGGTQANPLESDLYAFRMSGFSGAPGIPNTPRPTVVFGHDDRGSVDSHGAALVGGTRYLWAADRAANRIVIVDTQNDTVANEINLAGPLSRDPAPDLMEVSPDGSRVFLALRGPSPLTANAAAANNAVGSSPGLAVVRVEENGRRGTLEAIAPITHMVGGTERADPHGLRVRLK